MYQVQGQAQNTQGELQYGEAMPPYQAQEPVHVAVVAPMAVCKGVSSSYGFHPMLMRCQETQLIIFSHHIVKDDIHHLYRKIYAELLEFIP